MNLQPLLLAGLVLLFTTAEARDDRLHFSLTEALTTPAAKAKLNPNIRLEFGKGDGTVVDTYTANKKTNFFNKSDKEGCEWVFLSAVLGLQARAVQQGGTAVVNIHSVYRNQEFKSESEYECGAGTFVGGVALRGTVVK